MALVRANIEEDTKEVHDGFTNKISFQHHDQKIIYLFILLTNIFKLLFFMSVISLSSLNDDVTLY